MTVLIKAQKNEPLKMNDYIEGNGVTEPKEATARTI
jgi:hypothetical protein